MFTKSCAEHFPGGHRRAFPLLPQDPPQPEALSSGLEEAPRESARAGADPRRVEVAAAGMHTWPVRLSTYPNRLRLDRRHRVWELGDSEGQGAGFTLRGVKVKDGRPVALEQVRWPPHRYVTAGTHAGLCVPLSFHPSPLDFFFNILFYFNFFWPRCMVSGISDPRSGIEPRPQQ